MIRIADITLPDTAVWENEITYGLPVTERVICADGRELIYSGGTDSTIDIIVPKIAGEMDRKTALALKALAEADSPAAAEINGRLMNVVFRHSDTAVDLKPMNPKQTHSETDSYYGTIRLLEV